MVNRGEKEWFGERAYISAEEMVSEPESSREGGLIKRIGQVSGMRVLQVSVTWADDRHVLEPRNYRSQPMVLEE